MFAGFVVVVVPTVGAHDGRKRFACQALILRLLAKP